MKKVRGLKKEVVEVSTYQQVEKSVSREGLIGSNFKDELENPETFQVRNGGLDASGKVEVMVV